MSDSYAFLRLQYQEIIEHCEYLLRNSADPKVLAKANESRLHALQQLQRLNRTNA